MTDFNGKIALVTGASRGIGAAVAKGLAAQGAHLVLLAKTSGALEEVDDELRAAGHERATLVPLDLTDVKAIDRLGGALHERFGKLDMLVSAAGILGDLTPLPQLPPKQWDEEIAVNLTAHWRLVRSLDPLLRAADAGRGLFFTSSVARKAKPYWGAYSIAKAGLEKMVEVYAEEIRNISSVKVNLINPGPMRTQMRANAMPGEDPSSVPHPDEIVPMVLDLLSANQTATGELFTFTAPAS